MKDAIQSASEEKQTEFFNWLIEHKDKCATIIKSLPIIQFGKDFISIDEATHTTAAVRQDAEAVCSILPGQEHHYR